MDLKVMGMLLFILCTLFDKIIAFNHTSAEAECREKNGLASYRHFVGDEGSSVDNGYDLREGESAWISGYVKFSKFVAYHGCYSERKEEVFKYELEENNIYNCLLNCSQKVNITFIGIRSKFCYCANRTNLAYLSSKPDSDCNQELVNSNLESNLYAFSTNIEEKDPVGKETETNISMYRIINEKYLQEPVTKAQCVKSWLENGAVRYGTESCDYKADSLICTKSAHTSPPSTECVALYNTNVFIVSKSSTWLTSFKECLKCKRTLANFVYDKMHLTENKSYWTGIFRTFKIETISGVSGKNVCLSVKMVNSKMVLEPATCSAEKEYICENDFSNKTESTSTKKFVSSKPTTQTATEDTALNLNVVYIAVGAVFTVAFIITITCIILRKRKQLKNKRSQKQCYSKDLDNNITDNTIRGSLLDVAQRPELAQGVEDEVTYAIPDTAKKNNPLSDCDYDSIRVKRPGELKESTAKAKTIEDHVYGFHSAHPIDINIEVYDHLEATRKNNVSKPTDGIYNTLAEDSDTYNVLGHGNQEESSKSAVNQTQMKETCPTYDKLK